MRTTNATIHLILKKGKVLADGTHPIMLKVSFKGAKERSTGFSALPKFWDAKTEQLKKGYPNQTAVNAILRQQKEDALKARDKLVSEGLFPSPESIIQQAFQQPVQEQKNDLFSLIERYVNEQHLKPTTAQGWGAFKACIKDFNSRLEISDIDDAFMGEWTDWMRKKGLAEGSIYTYCAKCVCILHYAADIGILPLFPLKRFKYTKRFVQSKRETYIHPRAMEILFSLYYKAVLNKDGGLKEGHPDSNEMALYAFLLGFTMKGLAPVDLTQLKWADIRIKVINGKQYYAVDGRRQKTKQPFKIRLALDDKATDVLLTQMQKNSSDRLLPWSGQMMKMRKARLIEWCKKANVLIRKYNVRNKSKIEEIDTENVTYYAYRHSYIMCQLLGGETNLIRLAQETGKSYKTIWQYMSQMGDEDLV